MKKWYRSKTLWVNSLALVGIVWQIATGRDDLGIELQASILAAINVILRAVTKEGLAA